MRAVRVRREVLVSTVDPLSTADRDESAVPSYCHRNPLVRRLFWQRLDAAATLADLRSVGRVLDYGAGSGVLLPTLDRSGCHVVATDLHLEPCRRMVAKLGVGAELVPFERFDAWVEENVGRFDRIFALDVLEHVDEQVLRRLSARFHALLAPSGRLVESGPTESRTYRVARALAGFAGNYHHRNVYDIDATLRTDWTVERTTRLPRWPLPQGFLVTRYAPSG